MWCGAQSTFFEYLLPETVVVVVFAAVVVFGAAVVVVVATFPDEHMVAPLKATETSFGATVVVANWIW